MNLTFYKFKRIDLGLQRYNQHWLDEVISVQPSCRPVRANPPVPVVSININGSLIESMVVQVDITHKPCYETVQFGIRLPEFIYRGNRYGLEIKAYGNFMGDFNRVLVENCYNSNTPTNRPPEKFNMQIICVGDQGEEAVKTYATGCYVTSLVADEEYLLFTIESSHIEQRNA
jgi:hypothetical protein